MPRYASVKSVSLRLALLKVVPESTALANTAPLRSDPSKLTLRAQHCNQVGTWLNNHNYLSTIAFVKSQPTNLLFLAKALQQAGISRLAI